MISIIISASFPANPAVDGYGCMIKVLFVLCIFAIGICKKEAVSRWRGISIAIILSLICNRNM